jgi:hypothetical protein
MTFEELLREVRKIKCEEKRKETDDYHEVVVANAHLDALTTLLKSYFGQPFKPEGQQPSAKADTYSEPYGGVQTGQTMYVHMNGKAVELAILWPWGSGLSTTVKIIREQPAES